MPHGTHKTAQTAFRFPEGLLASLKETAEREGVTATAYVVAAIEEKLTRSGHGITTCVTITPEPVAVSPPPKRTRRPRADTAPAVTFTAPLDSPNARIALGADPDCPHPKARINKGLCGACGTNVGTKPAGGRS
jgi:hypothetical protein